MNSKLIKISISPVVRIDFIDQQISVLSIPRDLWVQIPDLAEHDITEGRINASYGYGEYFNGEVGGVISFANTLYTNYNVTFDHYLVVHFDSFEKIIDQIGGVDITLDQPLDGTLQGGRFSLPENTIWMARPPWNLCASVFRTRMLTG